MKRYLTLIFLLVSAVILFFGLRLDLQWTGAVTWGLTFICLVFAAYCTKFIPDRKEKEKSRD
ncbi:hypothetical protein GMD78_15375 [Ornithinibacillus sp. L9]|uniref:Uncharacterized protein n=1 Tax=Ornithinibacillus caprae TaxID=2678566 RepID=A0A6N8FJF6_9BACI|nr:hypothetical protein [Ornithinibacillus caprae]MUK89750.1 hypothetical protein [Ornithinibacillus caprae]